MFPSKLLDLELSPSSKMECHSKLRTIKLSFSEKTENLGVTSFSPFYTTQKVIFNTLIYKKKK
jgi:hypothetical protein